MHERPQLLFRSSPQECFDDAISSADHGGELGPGVEVQLFVDIHQMGGHGTFANEEAMGDLAVGKSVDDVADDLPLAITELLVEDRFHLPFRNEEAMRVQ